jgi:hypothetical protein
MTICCDRQHRNRVESYIHSSFQNCMYPTESDFHLCCMCVFVCKFSVLPFSYNGSMKEYPQILWNILHILPNVYGRCGCQNNLQVLQQGGMNQILIPHILFWSHEWLIILDAWSKVWNDFTSLNTGIVDLNSTQDMDVCISSVFVCKLQP